MKVFAMITVYLIVLGVMPALAQTTEFTYQGKINVSGTPATSLDFEFRLCATETETCSPPIAVFAQPGVSVSSSGIFSVGVNFGFGVFNGSERYIEVGVRRTGETSYTTLSPRQRLTSVPYAQQTLNSVFFDNRPLEDFVLENDPRLQPNYSVLNTTTLQPSVNFNVGGTGTASILNAATQFNLGGERILGGAAGSDNLFAGRNSGAVNAGSSNSFFGTSSGRFNTGNNNSFFGAGAGEINSTGTSNSFFGGGAGATNTSGRLNSFFGANAGISNTQGDDNAFFGVGAGFTNTTGGNNTFIGRNAGNGNVSGGNNTLIGSGANVGSGGLTNATAIGTRAFAAQSNSIVLGSINGLNGATADTRVGIGVTAPAFKLEIVDQSNAGLRVQTNTTGGTVASFASNGALQVDALNMPGGRLNILENGNVGIGNPSPTAKLEVTGNGTSSAALEVNNGAIRVTGAGVGTPTTVFVVERNSATVCADDIQEIIVINNPYTNNDPNAIVFITPVYTTRTSNSAYASVYYETDPLSQCPGFQYRWVIRVGANLTQPVLRFNVIAIKP